MKRGIIRIVSGVVLVLIQLLGMGAWTSVNYAADLWTYLGVYIGFYSPAIIGILLILYGARAYDKGKCFELILHEKTNIIHVIMKWLGVIVSILWLAWCLVEFVREFEFIGVVTLLNVFSPLAFSVYALFYMHKKPSCLFSTALLLIGVTYIYAICSNLQYYLYSILKRQDLTIIRLNVFCYLIPKFLAGILYIVVAVKIYKEKFSVNVIKVLGFAIFSLEILSRIVVLLVLQQGFYLRDLYNLAYMLYVSILFLYTSVLKINTLRGQTDNSTLNASGWRCRCGRFNLPHERYCVCEKPIFGKISNAKVDVIYQEDSELNDRIFFCRKCGEKFIGDGKFCRKCGTEVIREE